MRATSRAVIPSAAKRRIRRALGRDLPPRARRTPPRRPVGGKLELTFACNLRCGFCYTDSPRHTLARTPELSDEAWLQVADQLIDLGAIEAVLTGGEPLLRRELTIEMCRRLAGAGLGVTLNSNGWFIDDEVAAALAGAPGLHVHVSVDGPTARLHDASRGIPGSWRRAIQGLDALIRHGVAVHAVHVVTKRNVEVVGQTLDLLDTLGVGAARMTPVLEVGAAAREGGWWVDAGRIERAVEGFRERTGSEMNIAVQNGEGSAAMIRAASAPSSLLVRPDGAVRADSLNPFRFGHALDDGLAECWGRIGDGWRDPAIGAWRRQIQGPRDLGRADTIAYLDEVALDGSAADTTEDARNAPVPQPVAPGAVNAGEVEDPGEWVAGLALSRRYRATPVRVGGDRDRLLVRRLSDGRVWRLNDSASTVFEALRSGDASDAVESLRRAHPGVDSTRLRADAIASAHRLARWGLVVPERATAPPPPPETSASADLPQA